MNVISYKKRERSNQFFSLKNNLLNLISAYSFKREYLNKINPLSKG
jgi:hypothetical protein